MTHNFPPLHMFIQRIQQLKLNLQPVSNVYRESNLKTTTIQHIVKLKAENPRENSLQTTTQKYAYL